MRTRRAETPGEYINGCNCHPDGAKKSQVALVLNRPAVRLVVGVLRPAERRTTIMPYIRQRRVRSKAMAHQARWWLRQKRKDLEPMPGRKDIDELAAQAARELKESAKRLGVFST